MRLKSKWIGSSLLILLICGFILSFQNCSGLESSKSQVDEKIVKENIEELERMQAAAALILE